MFEDKVISISRLVLKVVSLYGFYFKEKYVSRRRVLKPPSFSDTRPLGFFIGPPKRMTQSVEQG